MAIKLVRIPSITGDKSLKDFEDELNILAEQGYKVCLSVPLAESGILIMEKMEYAPVMKKVDHLDTQTFSEET